MVTWGALWLPIVGASAILLVAGFVLWMVLPLHKGDFRPFPDEAAVGAVLRGQQLVPGQYIIPHRPR